MKLNSRLLDALCLWAGLFATCSFGYQSQLQGWLFYLGFGFVGFLFLLMVSHLEPAGRLVAALLYGVVATVVSYATNTLTVAPDLKTAFHGSDIVPALGLGLVAFIVVHIYVLRPDKIRKPPICSTEG